MINSLCIRCCQGLLSYTCLKFLDQAGFDTMCQNRIGKFWQWYCIFSVFQSQNCTDLYFLIPLAPFWTYCLISVDIEGEKVLLKECFVSCPPKYLHVCVNFPQGVTVVPQLCRSMLWLGASLAACFRACSLACLMHTKFCWKLSGHKGIGIFVAAVPEKEPQAGKRQSFPVAASPERCL